MNTAIIAFGSNLLNPVQQVVQAIDAVKQLPRIHNVRVSSLYRSAPVGYADQPDFINAVAMLQTEMTALALLHALQDIEAVFGRERSFRNAPRTLDLDLIDFNHQISHDVELTLPHPRAHERAFVMVPLAEIAPEFVLGQYGSARILAAKLDSSDLVRVA